MNNSLYSPWKDKVKGDTFYFAKKRKEPQSGRQLDSLKQVHHLWKERMPYPKSIGVKENVRHNTQPKQKLIAIPKMLKTEPMVV